MYGEQMRTRGIHPGDDKVRPDVPLVPEEVLLEQRHAGDDAGLPAGGEGVQLQVAADERGGELGVGGGAGAGAPDLRGDVVELLAVLVGDDGAGRGAGVGCDL